MIVASDWQPTNAVRPQRVAAVATASPGDNAAGCHPAASVDVPLYRARKRS